MTTDTNAQYSRFEFIIVHRPYQYNNDNDNTPPSVVDTMMLRADCSRVGKMQF